MTSAPSSWRRRGYAVVAAGLVTAIGVGALWTISASAADAAPIVGVSSGKCLDVTGEGTLGRGVGIIECNGASYQAWELTAAGELRTEDGTNCLDVAYASRLVGAEMVVWPCNGAANQRWTVRADGTIVGVQSGLCLDLFAWAEADGSPVVMWSCNGGDNQRWTGAAPSPTPSATPTSTPSSSPSSAPSSSPSSTPSPTPTGDTTAPSVPGNARVSGLACTSVTFSWNAATDNVGVAFYDIYHDGQQMTTVSGTTLSAVLTVVPGAEWGLYVNARDAAGNVSQASATVDIKPPVCSVDSIAPSTPTGVRATAVGTTVTVTWTAATDNVGVRSYDVLRNAVKVGAVTGSATVPPVTTFTDNGLALRTSYRYTVVARDAQSNASPPSAAAVVSTAGSCANVICEVTQVTTDTDIPWGLVTLADGSILYSRRDAHDIVKLNPDTGAKTTLGAVPNVASTDGEGGLMGLAISPSFATDGWLYIMHTSPTDNRIVRIKVENNRLNTSTEQVLISGILRNKFHDGGRLRFGPDGKLYASTGDAQNGANSQNLGNLSGKILRINPDGSVPSDNPFGTYVWSYGHRNPQGLAFDSQGRLWQQEFGNGIMDETNLITKGGNYGWPACEGTSGTCNTPGFIAPKRTYPTSEGSCSGLTIVRDVVYIACGRGQRLYRQEISGSSLVTITQHFNGTYGRLRTVEPAPDGGLWLTTTNTGDKDSVANNSNERILHVSLGG